MSTQQEKIDAWYENFIQQISKPPFSFLPHLPQDKGRLLKMLDEPKMDKTEMESPVGPDEDLFEKRNELYELASQGKLYIFELGSSYDCSQVRVEPANKLLYDLKNAGFDVDYTELDEEKCADMLAKIILKKDI